MFRVEIGRSLRRLRTWAFALGLAGLGALPVIILLTTSDAEGGPPFFEFIRRNGLFATLTAVAIIQPFFLPLGTSLLSGEALAGEATAGTLRYLLVRPVGRTRLVLSKYAAVMTQLAAAVMWVMLVALLTGWLAFGFGPFPTLSGITLGTGEAALRIGAAGAYVLVGVAGVAAIGVFVSTLTGSAAGAAVATMSVAITSQILDSLSALRPIHPYLVSHRWLAYADLFRSPVEWSGIVGGLVLAGAYTALFLGASLLVFGRKDVAS